jgi:hypothetical protein
LGNYDWKKFLENASNICENIHRKEVLGERWGEMFGKIIIFFRGIFGRIFR